jgi:predicted dehydrogenase
MLDEPNPSKDPSQFTAEAEYFSDCVLQDKTPKTAGEEGLLDTQYMSKIYESCGLPAL